MATSIIKQVTSYYGSSYIKTPDGLLIQWSAQTAQINNGADYTDIEFTFENQFINRPFVFTTGFTSTSTKSNVGIPIVSSSSNTGATVRVWRNEFSTTGGASPYIYIIAIGRWK